MVKFLIGHRIIVGRGRSVTNANKYYISLVCATLPVVVDVQAPPHLKLHVFKSTVNYSI